jgi:prepilin-type N-terminal cleavage/methylation domain-containing protein
MKKKNGFTLIELLVVATLVVVLVSLMFMSFRNSSRRVRDQKREEDRQMLTNALELYYETYKEYPVASDLDDLISDSAFQQYLQRGTLEDPLNSGIYVYSFVSDGINYQICYEEEVSGQRQCSESLVENGES